MLPFKYLQNSFKQLSTLSLSRFGTTAGLKEMSKGDIRKMGEQHILEATLTRMDQANDFMKLPIDKLDFYKSRALSIRFNIQIERKGQIINIPAYRVQHKTYKLPTKGGLRIYAGVSAKDLEAISIQNTLKCALFDIPFGGAKGGIDMDASQFSSQEIEKIVRKYCIELARLNMIGASSDLIGIALGSSAREMNWIQDTYQNFFGQDDVNAQACTVGKSFNFGGIVGNDIAVGYGMITALRLLLENPKYYNFYKLKPGIKGRTFIVQGFGHTGYQYAQFLCDSGAKLIGVAEVDGSIYNPNGMDPTELLKYYKSKKGVKGFPGAKETFDDGQVIFKECDIFCPCFKESQIHVGNVDGLKCKMIVEGANSPITPLAGDKLYEKGVFVVPDIYVNSGATILAYFEWIKNLSHQSHGLLTKRWEEKSKGMLLSLIQNMTGLKVTQLNSKHNELLKGAGELDIIKSGIEEMMSEALENIYETSKQNGSSIRMSAHIIAIKKLHEHYSSVGLVFK